MQEQGTREHRWLRLHALTAPIGVAAVTALLAWLGQSTDDSQPQTVRFLNSAAGKAYLGTVTYALIIAAVERTIRMAFWAWSEHKKAIDRFKSEGRAEGRAEGLAEGLAEGRKEAVREYEQKLAQREAQLTDARERARAEGIDLDKYLNP